MGGDSSAPRKTLAVLTTGRQDYGILRGTLLALRDDPRFALRLWAGGMHLRPEFGRTVDLIARDGLAVDARLDFLADARGDVTAETAAALSHVGAALARERPDALVLLGDRSETLAAGVAATLAGVPVAHLHGGEETEGAIDNALRHALTKLAHLHLVSHASHARRVLQMGEDPASVHVVGAAGLDNLYRADLPDRAALEQRLGGFSLAPPVVVTTVHPTTLGDAPLAEVSAVARAMERVAARYVVTQPNADAGGRAIREFWLRWSAGRDNVVVVDALGEQGFWGMLKLASAMLGNSSSGIIEAPAAGLPVVNVGDRQRNRLRSPHVIDVPVDPDAVAAALRDAVRPDARARLADVPSHYPAGPAAPRIIAALAGWTPPRPARKRFYDYGAG